MEPISPEYINTSAIQKRRLEVLTNINFTQEISTGSVYSNVSASFYGVRPIEIIPNQELLFDDTVVFVYQSPLRFRGDGIIPSTIEIESVGFTLTDDGNGNLKDGSTVVGNVFYNTGFFILSDEDYNETVTIRYDRFANFLETRYIIPIQSNLYNNSSNNTFFDSDAPHPFLTKILLYNSLNEVIGMATLSSPIELDTDITFVLDLLST